METPSGSGERLGGFDRTILATEKVGRCVSADCAWLLRFDGTPPSLAQLREHVAERVGALPWLTRRLTYPVLKLGAPRMVEDPDFEISERVLEVPEHFAPEARWLKFVGDQLSRSVAKRLPSWTLHLAVDEDRYAFILRHHHFLADGKSGFQILRTLLAGEPHGPPVHTSSPSPLEVSIRGLAEAGRVLKGGRRGARLIGLRGEDAAAFAAAVTGWLKGPRPPRVPDLNRPLSYHRRVATVAVPFSEVQPIIEQTRCYPNEVYLALVAGALRGYLQGRGVDVDRLSDLQAGTMVDIGGRRHPRQLGNHYAAVRLPLPVAERDVHRRLEAIRAARMALHRSHEIDGSWQFVEAMARAPAPVVVLGAWAITSSRASINTIASHLAGYRGLTYRGQAPTRVCSWTYLPARQSLAFVCQLAPHEMTINIHADGHAALYLCELVEALEHARRELAVSARAETRPARPRGG